MAYRFRRGRPVGAELTRIASKQLRRAAAELTLARGPHRLDNIHCARRHVKKTRALLRLFAGALPSDAPATTAHLRDVGHALGRLTDGSAPLLAYGRLKKRYPRLIPHATGERIVQVLEHPPHRRHRPQPENPRRLARALADESRAVRQWTIDQRGFTAVAAGLRRTVRRGRRSMRQAWRHPTAARLHAWRCRVKDYWFEVRLLNARTGWHLSSLAKRLETLDGVLGEYHDLALLRAEIELAPAATLSRRERAEVMHAIARQRRHLRRRAHALGDEIYRQPPRAFVQWVKQLWQQAAEQRRAA